MDLVKPAEPILLTSALLIRGPAGRRRQSRIAPDILHPFSLLGYLANVSFDWRSGWSLLQKREQGWLPFEFNCSVT